MTVSFADDCWKRAAQGMEDPEARETLKGPVLDAEVYSACDLVRLSFTYKDGGRLRLDEKALAAIEKAHGLSREVRTPLDASGEFNFILTKGGTYVARVTADKLFCEPKACGLDLGRRLLALYDRP